ncbi:hypothetical protein CI109_102658 [Kwoniella shandongensis]|uniref:Protein arginine methyltransferase NDUFAF7 n=1 Tax=Kwoniella shandongensis TaxID=1734106 RepID=A0A5M6BUD2_9TREE|nr:uncharacterized protein CI109_005238 [Kwoniella shandongensis]KAA5526468.1 hypothetical protein CI109_005238 [Kwoniella shandongensis]
MSALRSSRVSLRDITRLLRSVSGQGRTTSIPALTVRFQSTSTPTSPSSDIPAVVPSQNELTRIIRDTIKATGPIPVSRYMQFCLSHPVHGYYSKGDVFGQKGDFITSPEISQIFGELVAIWFLTRWTEADSPTRVRIVELGPGRGTLMDDILRTLFNFPGIAASIRSVHLVENSEAMRGIQSDRLSSRVEGKDIDLNWYTGVNEIPESPDEFTLFVAHEFFDAMPINVFEKTDMGWREVQVDTDSAYSPGLPTSASSSGLRLSISRSTTPLSTILPTTSPRFANLPVGSRIEIAQDSWKIMRHVGQLLSGSSEKGKAKAKGGCGLVIDYGADRAFGGSFRAFQNHKLADVFDDPGNADLTANVDFAYLRESLTGTATPLGPISQSHFLLSLGLQPRLRKLLETAPPERKELLSQGAQRLIDTLGMGSQYQVMGVVSGTDELKEEIYPFPLASKPVSRVLKP